MFAGLCPQPIVRAAFDRDLAANYYAQRQLEYDIRSYRRHLSGTAVLLFLLLDSGIMAAPLGCSSRRSLAGAGLCHYGLAYTAAVNLSPVDRYALYFRL